MVAQAFGAIFQGLFRSKSKLARNLKKLNAIKLAFPFPILFSI